MQFTGLGTLLIFNSFSANALAIEETPGISGIAESFPEMRHSQCWVNLLVILLHCGFSKMYSYLVHM